MNLRTFFEIFHHYVQICFPVSYTRLADAAEASHICCVEEVAIYRNLLETGPVVEAEIFASEEAFLKFKNFCTPESFAKVKLLVDTGSNISGLDNSIIKILHLPSYSETEDWVQGQGGSWQVVRYSCVLYLPIFKKKALTFDVLGGNFSGSHFDGVVGRDVLRFCDFRYDGLKNTFSLTAKGF
ncbi:MAG: hypothetical protein K2X48_19190 [Chitinophagaceae bacterium]|nr:hypothetical protein [Chitinophagaceae bacterium]